jgi:hypothetical protein
MSSRINPSSCVRLAAVLALGAAAGCGRAAEAEEQRPATVASTRKMVPVTWTRGMHIGGAEDDTALISPFRLTASREGVHVIDFYPKRVRLFGHDGRVAWTFGRPGAGPGEFRDPRDLKLDSAGNAWVMDPANVRVTVLDRSGQVARSVSLSRLEGNPRELVSVRADQALLLLDGQRDAPLVRVDASGKEVARDRFPWQGFAGLHYLSSQLVAASSTYSEDWVMAFRVGDGFFLDREQKGGGARRWFVEHVPFPEVVESRAGNTTTWRHAEHPVDGAIAVTLSPSRVYVLFGGTTRERGRIVDSYSLADGSYVESRLLPRRVSEIAWYDGGLYTLANQPYPELAYLKPEGTPLP